MKLMIVDDDQDFLRSLEVMLLLEGHNVCSFSNPVEAWNYLRTNHPLDVLITDFKMPIWNGDYLIRKAKLAGFDFRAYILVSGQIEKDGSSFNYLETSQIFSKPLNFEDLLEVLDSIEIEE